MKLLAFLSAITFSASTFAAPYIEVAASISGAPAGEASRAFGAPAQKHLTLPCVTARPGKKTTVEMIRVYHYPTKGGASPTAFETRNLGGTLAFTATPGADGVIAFDGALTIPRYASGSTPSRNHNTIHASTIITREVHFTGQSKTGEPVIINIGEQGRDSGQLKLTFTHINPK